MTTAPGASDARVEALRRSPGARSHRRVRARPASADASFRRYFRDYAGSRPGAVTSTLIVMDAPPPMEDCRPFVHVAALLRSAGLNAPEVLADDSVHGFLLLTDLGTRTYLEALDATSAPALYSDATDALIRWQQATRGGALPPYDEALLARELDLFPDWYVARHLRRRARRRTSGDVLARSVSARSSTTTSRSRGVRPPRLPFAQPDGRRRPIPASSISGRGRTVRSPTTSCRCCATPTSNGTRSGRSTGPFAIGSARASASLPVDRGLRRASGATSNGWACSGSCKVLGIFARLYHRDGKAAYLDDMPRVLRYLRRRVRALTRRICARFIARCFEHR